MWIDIGANLCDPSFNSDRTDVIKRALEAGVSQMMVTGSDLAISEAALDLSTQWPGILYASAGVHPHHAESWDSKSSVTLEKLAQHSAIRAIGEAGLDFYRNYASKRAQLYCLEAQLDLAAATGKPVFLHERDAFEPFFQLVRRYRSSVSAIVVHCFTGEERSLRAYLDMDAHIGLTGWFCDERRGTHLHDLVKMIPLERLMLETDAPYLLPRNLRPKPRHRRNEPAFLPWIAQAIAHHLDISETSLADYTSATARQFFHLPDSNHQTFVTSNET